MEKRKGVASRDRGVPSTSSTSTSSFSASTSSSSSSMTLNADMKSNIAVIGNLFHDLWASSMDSSRDLGVPRGSANRHSSSSRSLAAPGATPRCASVDSIGAGDDYGELFDILDMNAKNSRGVDRSAAQDKASGGGAGGLDMNGLLDKVPELSGTDSRFREEVCWFLESVPGSSTEHVRKRAIALYHLYVSCQVHNELEKMPYKPTPRLSPNPTSSSTPSSTTPSAPPHRRFSYHADSIDESMSSISSVEVSQSHTLSAAEAQIAGGHSHMPEDESPALAHSVSEPLETTPSTRSRNTSSSSSTDPFFALTDSPPRVTGKSISLASKPTSFMAKARSTFTNSLYSAAGGATPRSRSRSRSPGAATRQKSPNSSRRETSERQRRRDSQPSAAFRALSKHQVSPQQQPSAAATLDFSPHSRVRSESIGVKQAMILQQLSDARPVAHVGPKPHVRPVPRSTTTTPAGKKFPPDHTRPLSSSATCANLYSAASSPSAATVSRATSSPTNAAASADGGGGGFGGGSRTLPRTRPPSAAASKSVSSSPASPAHKASPMTTPHYSVSNYHNRNGFFGHGQDHGTPMTSKELSSLSPRSKSLRASSTSNAHVPMYYDSLSRSSGRGRVASPRSASAGTTGGNSETSEPSISMSTSSSSSGAGAGAGGKQQQAKDPRARPYGSLSRGSSLHEEMSIRDILNTTPEDLYREDSKSTSDREWIRHALMTRGFKKSKVEDAVHKFKTYRECLYDLQPKLNKHAASTDPKSIKKYLKALGFTKAKIERALRTKLPMRDCLHLLEPHMITVYFAWDQKVEIDAEIMADHPDFGWSKATVRGLDESVRGEEKVLVRYETFFGDDEWLSIESERIGERKQASADVLTQKIMERIKRRGKKDVTAFLRILKALQPDAEHLVAPTDAGANGSGSGSGANDKQQQGGSGSGSGSTRDRTSSRGRRENFERADSFSSSSEMSTTSSLEGISFLDLVMGFGGGSNSDGEPSRSSTSTSSSVAPSASASVAPSSVTSKRTPRQARRVTSSSTSSRRDSTSMAGIGKRSTGAAAAAGTGGDSSGTTVKRHSRSRSRGGGKDRSGGGKATLDNARPAWNFDQDTGGDRSRDDGEADDESGGLHFWEFLNTALDQSCELTEGGRDEGGHSGSGSGEYGDDNSRSSHSSPMSTTSTTSISTTNATTGATILTRSVLMRDSSPSSSSSASPNTSSRGSMASATNELSSLPSTDTASPTSTPAAPHDIRVPKHSPASASARHSRAKSVSPLSSPLCVSTQPAPSKKQVDDLLALVKQNRDEHLMLAATRRVVANNHRRSSSSAHRRTISHSPSISSQRDGDGGKPPLANALNPLLSLARQKHSHTAHDSHAHANGTQTPPLPHTSPASSSGTSTPPAGSKANGVPRAVSSGTATPRRKRGGLFGLSRKHRAQTAGVGAGGDESPLASALAASRKSVPSAPHTGGSRPVFESQTMPASFVSAVIKPAQDSKEGQKGSNSKATPNPFDEQAKELGLNTHRRLSVLNDAAFESPEPQPKGLKRFFKSKKSAQVKDPRHKLSPAGSSLMNVANEMAESRTSSSSLINELERHIARTKGYECFRKHLEKEASEENLDFVMAVSKFRAEVAAEEAGSAKLISLSSSLFKKFIEAGAEEQINLSWGEVKRVRRRLDIPEKIDHKIFDEARHAIMHLMAHDSFRRYIRERVQARRDHSKHVMNVIDSRLF